MKKILLITVIIAFFFSISCTNPYRRENLFDSGKLPSTPENLLDFNTVFDDFNAAAPITVKIPLCFSTNRHSNGNDFDIICQAFELILIRQTGELNVINMSLDSNYNNRNFKIIEAGLNKIKSSGNELGPNLISNESLNYTDRDTFTLLYSTNVSGNAQINFITNRNNEFFSEPKEVSFLNSNFDDLYPTFNSEKNKIYFCSNRNQKDFNFYYVNVNPVKEIDLLLSDTSSYEIFMDSTLSGSSDDKCPFIFGNKMVFASNRSGGYGGYDLYYSIFKNGEWSSPVNFGEKINSTSDDFRPIIFEQDVSKTQLMMVFSSNRPGGLGGYDLYFTGIEK